MYETVTVDEALAKGKRQITYPVIGIFFGGIAFIVLLAITLPDDIAIYSIGGLLIAFLAPWLYWSFAITKWRLWAFENVRNVHELKKRAVQDQLIWMDGSWFEKTEIRNDEEQRRWAELQLKFNKPDVFHDDLAVPVETQVRYSQKSAAFLMILGFALLSGGVCYYLFQNREIFVTLILTIAGGFLLIIGYRNYTNRDPQIILSDQGVSTSKTAFYSWADITGEDTKYVQHGKSGSTYFIYKCPEGSKRMDIGVLDVSKTEIQKLLRVYRGRFESRQS